MPSGERNLKTNDMIILNLDKINENNIFITNNNLNANRQLSSKIISVLKLFLKKIKNSFNSFV